MTMENYSKHSKDHNKPDKQRALVLQGGGALGAYEVGVLKVLCKKLLKDRVDDSEDRPLFDIVAGSSMGAMNAAVLVSNVVNRHKTWEEAVEVLEDFWMNEKTGLASTPDFSKWWWDAAKKQTMFSASSDAARRYYSVKEYLKHGTPNVCSGPKPVVDFKFADPDNTWYLHDIDPLQHTIERYSKDDNNKKLRIATSWSKREPRLLVISVNVAEGKTIVFDSYHTKDDSENAIYEGDGITIDHIMASGTIPIFYKFRVIGERSFYDGGFLNNTPFRELLQAHRDYWTKVIGDVKAKIPDLDVYIVNVHTSKNDIIPSDHDGVNDRINDITYSDRNSGYDEMVTYIVTDYNELEDTLNDSIGLIRKLKALKNHIVNTSEGAAFQNELENLLMMTEGKSNDLKRRKEKYKDLIKGKFRLNRVLRIERTNDIDTSTGKEADYSSKPTDFTFESIKKLIEQGEEDALKIFERC
jgi:NTE family protein